MMKYYKRKIPPMEGIERELMVSIFEDVKGVKGLTTALDEIGGINGKWINPDLPLDIDAVKIIRINVFKALYQTEDEYIRDVMKFRRKCIRYAIKHLEDSGLKSKYYIYKRKRKRK